MPLGVRSMVESPPLWTESSIVKQQRVSWLEIVGRRQEGVFQGRRWRRVGIYGQRDPRWFLLGQRSARYAKADQASKDKFHFSSHQGPNDEERRVGSSRWRLPAGKSRSCSNGRSTGPAPDAVLGRDIVKSPRVSNCRRISNNGFANGTD